MYNPLANNVGKIEEQQGHDNDNDVKAFQYSNVLERALKKN